MADVSKLFKLVYISSTNYAALETKDPMTLYFIKNTGKVFRGSQDFTESVRIVASYPETNQAQGVLYINSTTSEIKTWTGSAWRVVLPAIDSSVTENSTNLVTSGAVYTAIDDAIGDIDFSDYVTNITWDNTNRKLKVYKDDDQTVAFQVELDKIATDIAYDGSTGVISLKDVKGNVLQTVNIPLDNFVKDGYYDSTTESLVLEMQNGTTVSIPVSALIDIYYGSTTATAVTTVTDVSGQTQIQVNVRISARTGNAIQTLSTSGEEGLYVDISGKVDKVTNAVAGNIATFVSGGNVQDSGKVVGGSTISASPDANTLATEAAVQALANTKADLLTAFTAGDIATLSATGGLADSGKTIGGATITIDQQTQAASANILATEAGVKAYADGIAADVADNYILKSSINTDLTTGTPTDTQVASAAAVVDLMSWEIVPD